MRGQCSSKWYIYIISNYGENEDIGVVVLKKTNFKNMVN
jgi:hypothetical protein